MIEALMLIAPGMATLAVPYFTVVGVVYWVQARRADPGDLPPDNGEYTKR